MLYTKESAKNVVKNTMDLKNQKLTQMEHQEMSDN